VIIGAVGFLLYKGLGSAVDYYEPVNVALAHRAELGTSSFRIEGIVLPGSIAKVADGVEFRVEWANKSVPVVATSTPPSMFQPDMPVVLDGHFLAGTRAIFDCDQIMVKHSTVYQSSGPSTTLAPIPGNQ
jgi:cytochrome c-type biogenesis protein CcmE